MNLQGGNTVFIGANYKRDFNTVYAYISGGAANTSTAYYSTDFERQTLALVIGWQRKFASSSGSSGGLRK